MLHKSSSVDYNVQMLIPIIQRFKSKILSWAFFEEIDFR